MNTLIVIIAAAVLLAAFQLVSRRVIKRNAQESARTAAVLDRIECGTRQLELRDADRAVKDAFIYGARSALKPGHVTMLVAVPPSFLKETGIPLAAVLANNLPSPFFIHREVAECIYEDELFQRLRRSQRKSSPDAN